MTCSLVSVICTKNETQKLAEYSNYFNTKQFARLDEKDVSRYNEKKVIQWYAFGDTFAVDEMSDMVFPANLVVDDTYTTEREANVIFRNSYVENLPEFLTGILYNSYVDLKKSSKDKIQNVQYGDSISGCIMTHDYYSNLSEKTDIFAKSIRVFLKNDNKILSVYIFMSGEQENLLNQDYIIENCLEYFNNY